jgi:hypothetical protein
MKPLIGCGDHNDDDALGDVPLFGGDVEVHPSSTHSPTP